MFAGEARELSEQEAAGNEELRLLGHECRLGGIGRNGASFYSSSHRFTTAGHSTQAKGNRTMNATIRARTVRAADATLPAQRLHLHLQLEQWCEQYGPAFRLQLGPRKASVVGDHEVIAAALRDRPDGFRRTARLEQVWTEMGLLNGLFSAYGDTWKRQLCQPTHMTDTVKGYLHVMAVNMRNQAAWNALPELRNWIRQCRLDGYGETMAPVAKDDVRRREVLARLVGATAPALKNLEQLTAA